MVSEVKEGEVCPKTGTWTPSNNPNFYPADYAERVMVRKFTEGEIMPKTPHGEPSWIFKKDGKPMENFTGLSAEEISEKVRNAK